VPVFDISATDGEELPSIVNKLAGDDPSGLFEQPAMPSSRAASPPCSFALM